MVACSAGMRAILLIGLLSTLGAVAQAEEKASRPNVLMIAVDDLRPMLGCYGNERIQTPNIDRLAARGRVYEQAYCQYAKCGTSRLSIMTGLRPDSIGVFSNSDRDVAAFRKRKPGLKPMGQWFREIGYHTRSFGKIYHDGWDNPANWSEPSSPGRDREMWEVVVEDQPMSPTVIAERLDCPVLQSPEVPDDHLFAGRMTREVESLLESPGGKPFFFAVGYRRPHLPFVAPKRYFDLYQPDEHWLAPNAEPPHDIFPLAWFNSDGYIGSAKRVGLTMPKPPTREEAIAWNGYEMRSYNGVPNQGPISRERQLELIHAYAACISYVDAQVGRLLAALEKNGQEKNTIVVLWSDHGWHLGEFSAWGKMTNYDIANRVPLIFAGPGIEKGREESFAELVDLYPTLCGLAGIDPPEHLEGDDLRTLNKDAALSQYERYKGEYTGYSIRTHQYRYTAWFDRKGKVVGREYYDKSGASPAGKNLAAEQANLEAVHERLLEAFSIH